MSLVELQNEFNIQKKKLDIFIDIKQDEKIMENKQNKVLYVEPPGYFQIIKRWWYGEDRYTTFNYLDKYFTEFVRFLDNILVFLRAGEDKEIIPLGYAICEYINKIIPGIHVLKATYPNYNKLHNKIGSIIITMIDFKDEFKGINTARYTRERAPSL